MQDSGQIELWIRYNWKPYLEHRENVSGEIRKILEQLEETVNVLKTALDENQVSSDFQEDTNLVFLLLKGTK